MFKRIALIVVLLAALGGGGLYAYTRLTAVKTSATASLQTTVAQTGNLTAAVTASGALASPLAQAVTWQAPGHVGKVDVQVGQVVHAGDVIMELNPDNMDTSLVQAQAQLLSDQAALVTLMTPPTSQQLANANLAIIQASQAVTAAQRTLSNVLHPVSQSLTDTVTTAQVAADTAQANLTLESVSAEGTALQTTLNSYNAALTALQKAQSQYQSDLTNRRLIAAQNNFTTAQDAYAQAKLTYDTHVANLNLAVTTAQSTLGTAQATLNNAKAGPNTATVQLDQQQVAVAQANLTQAQANLATLQAGAAPSDIALAKAKIAVDQAVLAKTQLVAPFDGTVTEIDTLPGLAVNAGTQAVVLADLSSLNVQIQVAEVDISKVKLGQEADLTLDALSGEGYTGTVTAIGYIGASAQGVVNFPVTVNITHPDPALKAGMTASAAIVTQEHDNVLLVPNRAIHVSGGQRTVTVLFEGQQIPVTVQVGLSDGTQSEIIGGQLKAGDTIVLNATTAASTTGGGFGGGLGGFARGG